MKNSSKDTSQWIPKEIFYTYCGGESDKLSKFYNKAVSKKNLMSVSINWLAILIFPAWLGYRRQWNLFLIYLGIFSILPILESLFQFFIPDSVFFGFMVALGLMANGILLLSANRIYHKLLNAGLEQVEIEKEMKNKAQGSPGLAVAATIVFFAITFACTYIADLLIAGAN